MYHIIIVLRVFKQINDNLCDSSLMRSWQIASCLWFKFGQGRMDLSVV